MPLDKLKIIIFFNQNTPKFIRLLLSCLLIVVHFFNRNENTILTII